MIKAVSEVKLNEYRHTGHPPAHISVCAPARSLTKGGDGERAAGGARAWARDREQSAQSLSRALRNSYTPYSVQADSSDWQDVFSPYHHFLKARTAQIIINRAAIEVHV